MNEFLQPTATIDSDAPCVVALAAELAEGAAGDEEVARRCFLWVRDKVQHSSESEISTVTCSASQVLQHRVGFCFAKSHLLAALLRARGVPAALCYQRLLLEEQEQTFCLHGLVAVWLQRHGWYRVDPRGNKQGIKSAFCPPTEQLAYSVSQPGEMDVPRRFADALPCVVAVLCRYSTAQEVAAHLPDYLPSPIDG